MPIRATCACGKTYTFKDEFAGRRAKCAACGQVVQVPGTGLVSKEPPKPVPLAAPSAKESVGLSGPATALAEPPASKLPPARMKALYAGLGICILLVVAAVLVWHFVIASPAPLAKDPSQNSSVYTAPAATSTVAKGVSEVPAATLRYDGLYRTAGIAGSDGVDYWHYLRFYSDGTVITVCSSGEPEDLLKWFSKEEPDTSFGKFTLQGNHLSFSSVSKDGTVDYAGEVNGDQIRLSLLSHINWYEGKEIYYYVGWHAERDFPRRVAGNPKEVSSTENPTPAAERAPAKGEAPELQVEAKLTPRVSDGRNNMGGFITPPKGSVILRAFFTVNKADSLPLVLDVYHVEAIDTSGNKYPVFGILPDNIPSYTVAVALQAVRTSSGIGELTNSYSSSDGVQRFELRNIGPQADRSAKITFTRLPGGFTLFFAVPEKAGTYQIQGIGTKTVSTGNLTVPKPPG